MGRSVGSRERRPDFFFAALRAAGRSVGGAPTGLFFATLRAAGRSGGLFPTRLFFAPLHAAGRSVGRPYLTFSSPRCARRVGRSGLGHPNPGSAARPLERSKRLENHATPLHVRTHTSLGAIRPIRSNQGR